MDGKGKRFFAAAQPHSAASQSKVVSVIRLLILFCSAIALIATGCTRKESYSSRPEANVSKALLPAKGRPNIVIILADDLGVGNIQAHFPENKIATPYLDRFLSLISLTSTDRLI